MSQTPYNEYNKFFTKTEFETVESVFSIYQITQLFRFSNLNKLTLREKRFGVTHRNVFSFCLIAGAFVYQLPLSFIKIQICSMRRA